MTRWRRRGNRHATAVGLALAVLLPVACVGGTAGVCDAGDHDATVAQRWVEVVLDAVRRDFPAPTTHARNLYHLSAAMYDAWAAFEPTATGLFSGRSAEPDAAAQEVAVAHAARVVADDRYASANEGEQAVADFAALAAAMCLAEDPDPGSPGAVGVAAADAVLVATAEDGAAERERYAGDYEPANPPLVVAEPGTTLPLIDRWQPLQFEEMVTQNGIPLPTTTQEFVGPHWGWVEPFALPGHDGDGMPIDPGPPPGPDDPAFVAGVVEVLRASSRLDPADGEIIDIGPGAMGDNPLGTNDGDGHDVNPVTGKPYAPNPVPAGDFLRVIAEIWADGPTSETPPGHWYSIARLASDTIPPDERRIAGGGDAVDALEWDVKLHLALGGALHDAAVAAWGAKRVYDYVRPISLIRHMGGLGQRSDPGGPAYDPGGLPLVADLIEVVTAASSASGERHEGLAEHVGEVAVRAWARLPVFFAEGLAPVRWIRAVDWLPYQMATFVTPAFAAYVSGHSTFSRAGAEILTAFTGSAYFPGGVLEFPIDNGALRFEDGPSEPFTLQWATYADAADQAGLSRIPGGIHVPADDAAGRRMGAEVGRLAWARAAELFGL